MNRCRQSQSWSFASQCVAAKVRCLALISAFLLKDACALRPNEGGSLIFQTVVDSVASNADTKRRGPSISVTENSSARLPSEGGSVILQAVVDSGAGISYITARRQDNASRNSSLKSRVSNSTSFSFDQASVPLSDLICLAACVVLLLGTWRLLSTADINASIIVLSQLVAFMETAGYSVLIPEVYELTSDMGYDPTYSGILLGICWIGNGVFSAYLLLASSADSYDELRFMSVASPFAAACGFLIFAIAANPPDVSLGELPKVRFWTCILARMTFHSGGDLGSRILLWRIVPSSETARVGTLYTLSLAAGFSLGPAISTLVNRCVASHTVRARLASPQYFMATCSAVLSFVIWWRLPRTLEECVVSEEIIANPNEPSTALPLATEDRNLLQHAIELPDNIRRGVFVFAVIFGFERAFCASCIESSVAYILESQYGLSPYDTGMFVTYSLLLGLPAFLLDYQTKSQDWTTEVSKIKRGSIVSFVATFGFFSAVGRCWLFSHIGPVWTLLLSAGLLFASSYVQSGIVEALCASVAYPSSFYSMKTYALLDSILQNAVARSLAPALSRYIVSVYGRDTYAAVQSIFVGFGIILTYAELPDKISEDAESLAYRS